MSISGETHGQDDAQRDDSRDQLRLDRRLSRTATTSSSLSATTVRFAGTIDEDFDNDRPDALTPLDCPGQLESETESSASASATGSPRSSPSAVVAGEFKADGQAEQSSDGRKSFSRQSSPKSSQVPGEFIAEKAAKIMSSARIAPLLASFPFFQDFEPRAVETLATVVTQATYKAGTVLFRQGDPPGSCYVIVSGALGVFVREASLIKQEDDFGEVAATQPRRSNVRHSAASQSEGQSAEGGVTKHRTVEGFSLYTLGADLGEQVATLHSGTITGEIALLHEQPRTATLRCMQDTSFIIIDKEKFESVLKSDMQRTREEKVNFLVDHLPGLQEFPLTQKPGGRPHPSYYFNKLTVAKGHEFLKQGHIAEDAVYIVRQGTVELRRGEPSTHLDNLSKLEASRRAVTANRSHKRHTGSVAFRGSGHHGGGQSVRKLSRHIGTLQVGSVFGSMPVAGPEPFTLVANTAVEVLYVKADMARFPRRLLDTIQEYLTQAMSYRLRHLETCRLSDSLQQGKRVSRSESRPCSDIGLGILLTGKLPGFKPAASHARGTLKSASQPMLAPLPSRQRPQSAPSGHRSAPTVTVDGLAGSAAAVQVEKIAGKGGAMSRRRRPASAVAGSFSSAPV